MTNEERALIAQQTAALERLNGDLAWFSTRQDYSTILLLRIVLALGVEPPEAVKSFLDLIPGVEALPAIAVPLGMPVSKLDRVATAETTYVDVVEWEVTAGHTGELSEIWMATTDYDKSMFRLVISGVKQWEDKYLLAAFTQRFKGNKLREKTKVLLQVKSSDGSGLTVYGSIAGKLILPPIKLAQPEGG